MENKSHTPQVHESLQESLEQGNINFDFLNPGQPSSKNVPSPDSERRNTQRQGKRGLFNRGRPVRPVTKIYIFSWISALVLCIASIVAIFMSDSLLWLLLLPVLFALLIWSLMMIPLLLVKPQ